MSCFTALKEKQMEQMIDLYEQLLGGNLCSTGNLLYSVIIFKKIKEYNIKIEATR